jgi:hypothetical protein
MRTVSPGEPILPALTAQWYNHTIKPHPTPPQKRPQPHRHQNEILAKFVPGGGFTEATRFDPVAITGFIDTSYTERICNVDKSSLNEYNWIIPQATMRDGQLSQPCVYTGLTFANVNIINSQHQFVTLNSGTKTLETADYGKGLLLKANPTGPSLISIETLPNFKEINLMNYVGINGDNLTFSLIRVKVIDYENLEETIDIPLTECGDEDSGSN